MTFRDIELEQKPSRDDCVSVGVSERKGLTIGLGGAMCAGFRVEAGNRFRVQIGTGENEGLIRLIRDKSNDGANARAARGMKTKGCVLSFGKISDFNTGEHRKRLCPARAIDDDTIEITLPAWAGTSDTVNFKIDGERIILLRKMAAESDDSVDDFCQGLVNTCVDEFGKEQGDD